MMVMCLLVEGLHSTGEICIQLKSIEWVWCKPHRSPRVVTGPDLSLFQRTTSQTGRSGSFSFSYLMLS